MLHSNLIRGKFLYGREESHHLPHKLNIAGERREGKGGVVTPLLTFRGKVVRSTTFRRSPQESRGSHQFPEGEVLVF